MKLGKLSRNPPGAISTCGMGLVNLAISDAMGWSNDGPA